MSYLRFEDRTDGVHIFFDDVTYAGPLGMVATFNQTDIATLDRAHAHSIKFPIELQAGPGERCGQDLHRQRAEDHGHDLGGLLPLRPRAGGGRNQVPNVGKMLFLEGARRSRPTPATAS